MRAIFRALAVTAVLVSVVRAGADGSWPRMPGDGDIMGAFATFRDENRVRGIEGVSILKLHDPSETDPLASSHALVRFAVVDRPNNQWTPPDPTEWHVLKVIGKRGGFTLGFATKKFDSAEACNEYVDQLFRPNPPSLPGEHKLTSTRDTSVAYRRGFAGSQPDEKRPEIVIGRTEVLGATLRVSGRIQSDSPVKQVAIFRAVGGPAVQGTVTQAGTQFTAQCAIQPGVRCTFKITAELESGIGSEHTIGVDASGTVTGQQTTSATGDTTAAAPVAPPAPVSTGGSAAAGAKGEPAKVPGMGGVGKVPGPSTPGQAAAGIVVPTLIAGALRILLGGLGGAGAGRSVPPVTPTSTAKEAQNKPIDQSLKAPSAGSTQRDPKSDVDQNLNRDPATIAIEQDADHWMSKLGQVAQSHENSRLASALDEVRRTAFGANGKVDPQKWAAARQKLRDAVVVRPDGRSEEIITALEYGKAVGQTGYRFAAEVGKGAWEFGKNVVWEKIGMPVRGAADLAYETYHAVIDPGKFIDDVKGIASDLGDQHARFEKSEYLDAMAQGHYSRAALALTMGTLKTGRTVGLAMEKEWAYEKYPIEEVQAIFTSEEIGAETRLWAVAAAAAKIAGLAVDQIEPTHRAATGWGQAIENTDTGKWIHGKLGVTTGDPTDFDTVSRQRLDKAGADLMGRRLEGQPPGRPRMQGHVPLNASMQTPSGRRAFYTGRAGGRAAAAAGASINDTELGEWAKKATEGKPWPDARKIWAQASERFALGADGDVDVFLEQGIRSDSVFNRNEVHVLLKNPSVRTVRINVMRDGKWELSRTVRGMGG